MGLILRQAAEMQEGGAHPSGARFSLSEIEEIAREAGISPEHVKTAAATLRERSTLRSNFILGRPWRFRFERSIEGEISDDAVGELIDHVRRELGLHGTVVEALSSVEWQARDSFGTVNVTVTRRGGRTSISVLVSRTDGVAVAGALGAVGAMFGSLGLGALLVGTLGIGAPLAAWFGFLGGTSASWLSVRGAWRGVANRWTNRSNELGETLIEMAKEAVELGRSASSAGP
jgi:hypothetical protein